MMNLSFNSFNYILLGFLSLSKLRLLFDCTDTIQILSERYRKAQAEYSNKLEKFQNQ